MVTLVACAHGTGDLVGRAAIASLVDAVRSHLSDNGTAVIDAFVDVQSPTPDEVVASLDGQGVLVPILLSAGFHVHVDLARAAASAAASPLSPHVTVARALGPDPRLAQLLERRLTEAGLRPGDAVVLGAAGSSDARAVADVEEVAAQLAVRIGRPVVAAYASASRPRIAEAVDSARAALVDGQREAGARVVVALYLLAPGHFADRAAACGADVVTSPLLMPGQPPPPELVDIVLERFYSAGESAQRHRNP